MHKRTHCPITGHNSSVVFSQPYTVPQLQAFCHHPALKAAVENERFEIRHCPTSGLYFQTVVPDDSELHLIYGIMASFEEEIQSVKIHHFAHQAEEILVLKQLCPQKRPTVLDFGCNWGKWASMALAYGCNVYGVECNSAPREFCSRRGIHMIDEKDLKDLRFDFINCDQVMEHLSDPLATMRRFQQCLAAGGIVKVSTPRSASLPSQLAASQRQGDLTCLDAKVIDPLYPLVHVNLFSRTSLDALAKQANLKPFQIPFWKWMGAGQLWNIPRQINRNLITPYKRWRGKDTYAWYQKT